MAASAAATAANAAHAPQLPCLLTGETKLQQPAGRQAGGREGLGGGGGAAAARAPRGGRAGGLAGRALPLGRPAAAGQGSVAGPAPARTRVFGVARVVCVWQRRLCTAPGGRPPARRLRLVEAAVAQPALLAEGRQLLGAGGKLLLGAQPPARRAGAAAAGPAAGRRRRRAAGRAMPPLGRLPGCRHAKWQAGGRPPTCPAPRPTRRRCRAPGRRPAAARRWPPWRRRRRRRGCRGCRRPGSRA
jgi:hypothetical protein